MKSLNHKILLFILAFFLMAGMNAFAEVSFKLVPRQNVVSGQNFQLTFRLTIVDEDIDNVSMPKAPEISGCRLLSGPNATTSQMSQTIINGKSSTHAVIDLVCIYNAGKQGAVKVPSVSINVGGRNYHTAEGSFSILPPDANAGSSQPGGAMPSVANAPSGKDFFVRVIFSKSSVYEQEGVVAITKLYRPNDRKFSLSLEAVPKMPVYEGFLSEDLEAAPDGQLENYNGKNYITYELSRVLLFPQKAGNLKVTSGTYTLKIQEQVGLIRMHGFATPRFEEYQMTTPMASGTLKVNALPEPRPADFIGAVGNYTLSTSLTPEQLRTNESATYTLNFKGTGNVKYLTVPTVNFPPTFDKYTAKTDVKANISGQTYTGQYIIEYPIVPQEVGETEIPQQTFSYFNLATKKYETLTAPAYNCNVAKGSGVATVVEQKQIDTTMDDILHIRPLGTSLEGVKEPVFNKFIYWILWITVACALLIAIFVYRRHLKLAADISGRKYARANRVASKRFKIAAKYMKAHQSDKFYQELANALKGYLGDKLSIPPSQLISETMAERLTDYGVSEETVNEVLYVFNECEMARFTPSQSDNAMHELYDKASAAIKSIEDTKPQKKAIEK